MKKTLLATLLGMAALAGSASAAVRFGIGVNIGVHAPGAVAPARVMARPPMPGPGYIWVDGYYGPNGFVAGYWAMPPFNGAYWVAPRFDGGRFVAGYWGGTRVMDTHTNFRAMPFHDDHFRGPDRDDRFHDRNDRSNDRFNDHRFNDQGRDFRH